MQMAEHGITLDEKLWESDWELQNTQKELNVVRGAVSKTQHLTLSKAEEARSSDQLMEGIEEQLGLARGKGIGGETASDEAAVKFKGEFSHLQRE